MQTPGEKNYLLVVTPHPQQVQLSFHNDSTSNAFYFLILSMISHPVK